MVPILGTPARKHLEENVAAPENELTPDELAPIDEVPPKGAASGLRCPEEMMKMVGL